MAEKEQQQEITEDVVQEVLDEKPRSILLGLISQLRKGMDLHRVTLPTFILEPRSMLERITDFMIHPDIILKTSQKEDELDRFLDVLKYFLSGFHTRPKGVKKPYNPVLGEFFRCKWEFEDGSTSYYVGEQVSHHPPISAFLYANPDNNLVIWGNLKPKSKFLGNSAATIMHGTSHLFFTDRPDEEYVIGNPNIYARGLLIGTMLLELGDKVSIECKKTGLMAEIEFKVKGFFTGTYNAISCKVKRMSDNETLKYVTGKWTESMYIQDSKKGDKTLFLDTATEPVRAKIVTCESEQDEYESRKLWANVTKAMLSRNLDLATEEKDSIENNQRHLAKLRDDDGIAWRPKFFVSDEKEDQFLFSDRKMY